MNLTPEMLKESENMHYKFQMGCYFSGLKKISGAVLLWSDRITDCYWNYASSIDVGEKELENLIEKVVEFYRTKSRNPAVYFTPFTKPRNLLEVVKGMGFDLAFRDAWMFYDDELFDSINDIEPPKGFEIKKVESKKYAEYFVEVFTKSYITSSENETYGGLSKSYIECLLDFLSKQFEDKKVINYLGFIDGNPVSIASIICSKNFGGIYNVCTIPSYRKRGCASTLILNAVRKCIKEGVRVIFLQTEHNTYNERFFHKLGFFTKFVGECYVLEGFD